MSDPFPYTHQEAALAVVRVTFRLSLATRAAMRVGVAVLNFGVRVNRAMQWLATHVIFRFVLWTVRHGRLQV